MYSETEIAVTIRPAKRSDLDAINRVVDEAMLCWARAAHVKAHTLPDLRYRSAHLDLAMLLVVVGSQQHVLGVVSCACATTDNVGGDATCSVLRLDGPYIDPGYSGTDIGAQLIDEAKALARRQGRQALVIEPRLQNPSYGTLPMDTGLFDSRPPSR